MESPKINAPREKWSRGGVLSFGVRLRGELCMDWVIDWDVWVCWLTDWFCLWDRWNKVRNIRNEYVRAHT